MPLKDFLLILRPINCLIAALGVLIGFGLSTGALNSSYPLLLAMIAVFLICGAGQAINDFFDLEIDKQSTKKRILTQKLIEPKTAYYYSIALFLIGIMISLFIGPTQFLIALVFSLLLFFYSWKLKNYKFLGNIIIATSTAFTIIFGASITGNYRLAIILAFGAFFANLSRELIKDIEDLNIDKDFKKTLPLMIPLNGVKTLALLFAIAAVVVVFIPYYFAMLSNIFYLFFLVLAVLAIIYAFKELFSNNYRKSHNFMKLAMLLVLVAFLGALI
ncbi:MAG: UbiA family prenyltransferase [archaeon]|nr:UbiA family prenyltransferase [archaeon]